MTVQTKSGKSFEYACALNLRDQLSQFQDVILDDNSATKKAEQFYFELSKEERLTLDMAARAAVKILRKMEPLLDHDDNDSPLILTIQGDKEGQTGDVRDILFIRRKHAWEIGVSIKHNHEAVKHSRLSETLDFGEKWLGIPCSKNYFDEIKPIFSELRTMKSQGIKWNEIENKSQRFYIPILESFAKELRVISSAHGEVIPQRLLAYLIGNHDFYKIISSDDRKMTQIQAFLLFGDLNKPSGEIKPEIKIPRLKMPTRFFDIYIKPESDNTLLLALDEGWQLSFRIHSASTLVEPSLKFDVRLIGQPNLYSHFESWE